MDDYTLDEEIADAIIGAYKMGYAAALELIPFSHNRFHPLPESMPLWLAWRAGHESGTYDLN